MEWLVVLGWVECEFAQDFAGCFVDDDDVESADERADAGIAPCATICRQSVVARFGW